MQQEPQVSAWGARALAAPAAGHSRSGRGGLVHELPQSKLALSQLPWGPREDWVTHSMLLMATSPRRSAPRYPQFPICEMGAQGPRAFTPWSLHIAG